VTLTLAHLGAIWLGAFLGAVASGGAGFAFALTASAIFLHVLDPPRATALVVACSGIVQVITFWPIRGEVEIGRLWPFLLGCVVGVPLGAAVLVHGGTGHVRAALGAFLLAYGVYALTAPRLHHVSGGGRAADTAIGFAGGVLGGLAGYSGVLPTIWTQLRGWPKQVARAVYQPFILVAHALTLVCVGAAGIDRDTLLLLAAALPALALGAWLGWSIYGRLDERRFRQALAALIGLSGLTLVL
jgi:uncharacterized membrane protein YfcA